MPSFSAAGVNKRYTDALAKAPLLTKAATLAVFAVLNEQLASLIAGDIQTFKLNKTISLPHTVTSKVPLMAVFAFFINAPLSHYGYQLVQKLVPSPLTPKKRLIQILLSTGVITPIFCAFFVSWIGLINNISAYKKILKEGSKDKLRALFVQLKESVVTALKSNFTKVTSTSVVTSPIFMLLAQKFVAPEGWAVFFAFCYFILGTYNNTKVKQTQLRLKKQQETTEEKVTNEADEETDIKLDESEQKEALKLKIKDVDTASIASTASMVCVENSSE